MGILTKLAQVAMFPAFAMGFMVSLVFIIVNQDRYKIHTEWLKNEPRARETLRGGWIALELIFYEIAEKMVQRFVGTYGIGKEATHGTE